MATPTISAFDHIKGGTNITSLSTTAGLAIVAGESVVAMYSTRESVSASRNVTGCVFDGKAMSPVGVNDNATLAAVGAFVLPTPAAVGAGLCTITFNGQVLTVVLSVWAIAGASMVPVAHGNFVSVVNQASYSAPISCPKNALMLWPTIVTGTGDTPVGVTVPSVSVTDHFIETQGSSAHAAHSCDSGSAQITEFGASGFSGNTGVPLAYALAFLEGHGIPWHDRVRSGVPR